MTSKLINIGMIPAKHAALNPTRDAVIDVASGRRVNFRELDERVRRVANGLCRDLGLERGDRVAVLARNCVEFQEIYFAAGRAGLITQPLNWRLSAPELETIVRDASPRVLVYAEEFRDTAEELMRRVDFPHWLNIEEGGGGSYAEMLAAASDDEPADSIHVGGDDPFMILYTGGTTGESKGVLHSHMSVYMGMLNQTVGERIVPTDVYMLTGQMFHIPVVLAMNYLAHGCPLVLINFEAKLALDVIQAEGVSAFLGITTMLNWMMAEETFATYDLSSLRNIQYGGGPMPPAVVRAALDAFPCTLVQGYGQTEGTTMTFLSQEDHINAVRGVEPQRLSSCGRECFATSVRILDAEGNPVAKDGKTPGEIVVRSPANMLGYWGNPELTAKTIRDGWMWTGDIATFDADGYVYIVDRAKDMIISGGENIYSVQVEEAIHNHPAVLEAAVIGVPDDEWGESVKAFVVLKPGTTATDQEIIDTAREHLASYQKPRSVEFVASLPKAVTGKIMKRELRKPYWSASDREV